DLLLLTSLVELLDLDLRIANVPALAAGVSVQFIGNKLFAFEDHSRAWARQGAEFALVEAGALLLNAVLFHLLAATARPYLPVRIAVQAMVYLGFSLPLWTRIFRQRSSS